MINNINDYKFVQGDIVDVVIDGGIMPVRAQPRILRGEDICFVAEAHEQRTDLLDQAVIFDSPNSYNGGYQTTTLSQPGQQFDFTRKLSLSQLCAVDNMNVIDISKLPGSGSPYTSESFYVRRWPQEVYWNTDFNTTLLDIQAEWADIVYGNINELLQLPNNLNGRILRQNEVSNIIVDTAKFRIPAYGYLDLNNGYSIGPTLNYANVDYQGDFNTNTHPPASFAGVDLWVQIAQNYVGQTPNGLFELYPNSGFEPARFRDNGDVQAAEYWATIACQYENVNTGNIETRISWRKVADMRLTNNWWTVSMTYTTWKDELRSLFRLNTGRLPINDYTVLQNTRQDFRLMLYTPCVFVETKSRFRWQ